MNMRWMAFAACAIPALLLGGCTEYWSSNYHQVRNLPGDSVLLTNADLRAVHRVDGLEKSQYPRMPSSPPVKTVASMASTHP